MDAELGRISILQERGLSPEAMFWVKRIQEVTQYINAHGFLKGGVLRDYISNLYNGTNLTPKDLDILLTGNVNLAVSMLKTEGASLKLRRSRRKTPVYEVFLPSSDGHITVDIGIILGKPATYGRAPNVKALIGDDAIDSDFTVNALYLPLDVTFDISNVIDPLGGIKDIKDRKIRMVSPDTFVRHPDCMLRAIKIADRLSATIEPVTFEAIQHYAPQIRKARQPLIEQNLTSILKSPNREQNIQMLEMLGLLNYLHITS